MYREEPNVTTRQIIAVVIVMHHFFKWDQFFGLSGSSGESQSKVAGLTPSSSEDDWDWSCSSRDSLWDFCCCNRDLLDKVLVKANWKASDSV
ncbi:hypothetical protein WICPIJ_008243 [Wickerhamomyces pijperi]|uniref:Uncharacterized protein n=1 Tax=Wickerhamomyces pijperi TaxID=599730 RepID=A0A9P8PXW4_WICPI|nr:hypothetical protein WICPIJ_008243 [Wickerhamomyces pijperi]